VEKGVIGGMVTDVFVCKLRRVTGVGLHFEGVIGVTVGGITSCHCGIGYLLFLWG